MIDEQKPLEEKETIQAVEESNRPSPETEAREPALAPEVEPGESETPGAPETLAPDAELAIAQMVREMETLQQQLQQQSQQAEEVKQRYIALAAEFDNFRKRTAREKEELEAQVKCQTIGELLAVVDNFERARAQIKPANEGEMAIHKSYQGVYKMLVDSLKKLGVSAMRPEGEPFDPNYHEAMLREYTDECPEGTVIEQLVRGYLLGDRVLRHAMVKVAAPREPMITSEGEQAEGKEGEGVAD